VLPIRDANPTSRLPIVTLLLIGANILIFLLWQPTLRSGGNAELAQQTFFWCHGLIPYEVTHQTSLAAGGPDAAHAIQQDYGTEQEGVGSELQGFLDRRCPDKSWALSILESMFLHGGWLHIGGNMLFLWIFGNNIEDRMGSVGYLLFYLLGGLAAAALQVALATGSTIPSVGASGAIAAVLGAYLVLYPRARVLTVVFFFLITIIELPAVAVLGFWFVLQLFSGIGQLGSEVNAGVAYAAHVGGFAFGVAVALVLFRRRGRGEPAHVPYRPDLY
jgi:membrane associated rhomboid family serine protease